MVEEGWQQGQEAKQSHLQPQHEAVRMAWKQSGVPYYYPLTCSLQQGLTS